MKIIIPGVPVPQGRMRHSTFRGYTQTYDPNSKEKKEIREIITNHNLSDDFRYPRISFIFHMPIPKSIPKRQIALYESGLLKHDKKPDVDNLVKLYLDCLDGIVFCRDQRVSLGPCIKVYSKQPKTMCFFSETSSILSPLELDCVYLDESRSERSSFCISDFPFDSYNLWKQADVQSLLKSPLFDTMLSLNQ